MNDSPQNPSVNTDAATPPDNRTHVLCRADFSAAMYFLAPAGTTHAELFRLAEVIGYEFLRDTTPGDMLEDASECDARETMEPPWDRSCLVYHDIKGEDITLGESLDAVPGVRRVHERDA